ncbi:MAG: hypothetical protein IPH81_20755 [Candidatus Microthrix sp.]|nr:hypothetical protein [Candidatus Microthrix sp.]
MGTFAAGALAGLIASLHNSGLGARGGPTGVINFRHRRLGIVGHLAVLLADQWAGTTGPAAPPDWPQRSCWAVVEG